MQQIIADLLRCATQGVPLTQSQGLTVEARLALGHKLQPCGYAEPESPWRCPDTGAHRTAYCEGGRLVSRGNGLDAVTDGTVFISARQCPVCAQNPTFVRTLRQDLGLDHDYSPQTPVVRRSPPLSLRRTLEGLSPQQAEPLLARHNLRRLRVCWEDGRPTPHTATQHDLYRVNVGTHAGVITSVVYVG